jgi:hypothetical protein
VVTAYRVTSGCCPGAQPENTDRDNTRRLSHRTHPETKITVALKNMNAMKQ